MNCRQPILIHKSVWDRLQQKTRPQEEPVRHNDEYIKDLIEKSQAWIKTWPDSVEGYMKKQREKKKKQHEQYMTLRQLKERNKVKAYKADALKKAKELIFEDSCYGKQLISALVQSKTLEERDLQIHFQNQIKKENIQKENSSTPSLYCTFNLDKKDEKIKEQNKLCALECLNENKKTMQLKKEKQSKEKEAENLLNQQDNKLMNQLLIKEIEQEKELKKSHKESLKEYEVIQRKIRQDREKQLQLDDALIKIHQKEQERRNCKIQQVLNKTRKDKQETVLKKHVYKIIESSQEKQNKRYHFIDDGIKSFEQLELKKDKDNLEKSKRDRQKLLEISEFNKNVHKSEQSKPECVKKCVCDKQSLIPDPCKEKIKANTVSRGNRERDDISERKLNFLKPYNKLVQELKAREKEPSAWSGTKAAHEQFAKAAGGIIQECKYKRFPRKVVDEYRKVNNLDSSSLPVPNY